MPDPDPIIDDELVVDVRVRLANPETTTRLADGDLIAALPSRVYDAIRPLLALHEVELAGIDLSLPDFKPTRYEPADTVDRDALSRIVAHGLGADDAYPKQYALAQVATLLGLEVGADG